MTRQPPQILLASRSPRRRALLAGLGLRFTVVGGDVDETPYLGESPRDYVRRVAMAKARAGLSNRSAAAAAPVLAADTTVTIDDRILGKPRGRCEAMQMLAELSGRRHVVYTAVALSDGIRWETALSVTGVTMRSTTKRERAAYWQTGEPRDKAGGYAIQGLGAVFIAHLDGSYSGVVGLPVAETADLLQRFNIRVLS